MPNTRSRLVSPQIALVLSLLLLGCGEMDVSQSDGGQLDGGGFDAGDLPDQPPETLGTSRQAQLVVPSTYDKALAYPVVFLFHAYATPPQSADAVWEVSGAAEELGFILVMPIGDEDDDGDLYWNSGPIDILSVTSPADDLAYILELFDRLTEVANVDRNRVIAMGASNGGNMSLHLICQASSVFTGALSAIGTSYPVATMCPAPLQHPPRVVLVKGTEDPHYVYEGGSQSDVSYPGAVEMAERFAERNGCRVDTVTTLPRVDVDYFVEGIDTDVTTYQSGCEGSEVRLYSVVGATHRSSQLPVFIWEMITWLFN